MITSFIHRTTAVAVTMLIAVVGADAPDSSQPVPVDCPAVLSGAVAPLARWRPDAPHGVHEFDRSTAIQLLPQISELMVEVWAGGGGGGGGSGEEFTLGGAGGGGGASGGYARGTFTVSPSKAYSVIVGPGGEGGAPGAPGRPGRASALCENSTALLYARGGPGGLGAPGDDRAGQGGRWLDSDVIATIADTFQRAGHDGHRGSPPSLDLRGLGGRGATAVEGTIEGPDSGGGDGGAGAMRPDFAQPGAEGAPGLVIVSW